MLLCLICVFEALGPTIHGYLWLVVSFCCQDRSGYAQAFSRGFACTLHQNTSAGVHLLVLLPLLAVVG